MSIKKILFAVLLSAAGFLSLAIFTTEKTHAAGECAANGGSCVASYATCATPLPEYNNGCAGNQICCNLTYGGDGSNQCKSNGGSCVASYATCATPLYEYNNSCAGDQICCNLTYGGGSGSGGGSGAGTGTGGGMPTLSGIQVPTGTGLPNPGGSNPVLTVILTFLKWLLTIFVILAFIAFIITGIQFLVALGNSYSTAATNAKNNFQYAVIALVVVGASYIIVLTIDMLLRGGGFGFF